MIFAGCRHDQLPHLLQRPEIVPVVEVTRALLRDPSPVIKAARAGAYFRLSAPLLESDASFLRRTVTDAMGKGLTRWVLPDAGHFRFFAPPPLRRQATLVSDHYLYAFNTAALAALSRMGAARMILPVEITMEALRDVGSSCTAWDRRGVRPGAADGLAPAAGFRVRGGVVVSPRGSGSPWRPTSTARRSIRRSRSPPPVPPRDARGGIRDFFADLAGSPAGEAAAVLSALMDDRAIPGTSTFNLHRGNF